MIDPAAGDLDDALLRRVAAFLYHEAELLDDRRFDDWLLLMSDDVRYRMPLRVTRDDGSGSEFSDTMAHFDEDRHTLEMRIARLRTPMAWAENPPSRTRHFVTNIRVALDDERRIKVRSNVLLYRNRADSADHDLLSAERHDVLCELGGKLQLAERVILIDQSTLATLNLAVFI
jgi:3-phenylpropionate/cinnamic acid dioxygenase small subunit